MILSLIMAKIHQGGIVDKLRRVEVWQETYLSSWPSNPLSEVGGDNRASVIVCGGLKGRHWCCPPERYHWPMFRYS